MCSLPSWLLYESEDPYGQLKWLAETLLQAEKDQEKVHILYHIPTGSKDCVRTWSREFHKIIDRKRFSCNIPLTEVVEVSSKAKWVRFPAGSFQNFRVWKSPMVRGGYFWGISRFPCPCITALAHLRLVSPSSTPKTSLLRAVQTFESTITAQFNGHTHFDEFHVYYDIKNSSRANNVALNGGSVTSYENVNMNYKIYSVDPSSWYVIDGQSWVFNLTEANLHPGENPKWYKLYSYSEAFGVRSLVPSEVDSLVKRMSEDPNLLQKYNRRDSRILQDWLEIHSPFQHEHNLHSLSSGISAESRVNCDNAQAIGETALQAIVGKTFAEAKISRKARLIPFRNKNPGAGSAGMRRSCPCIVFGEQAMATTSQEGFLSNKNNKGHLIAMLKLRLVEASVRVVQAKYDADILTVTIALDIELSENTAILVGIDTDLLVMLIYRNRPNGNVKVLQPSTNITSAKVYDITANQKYIGDMQSDVLFTHAVTRGDKTSAIYGKGKIEANKLLQKNACLRSNVVNIFNRPASRLEEVANTCKRFVRALYPGGDKCDNIDDLRLHLYNRTVTRQALTSFSELAVIFPTIAALYQHSLRTYLQVDPTVYVYYVKDASPSLRTGCDNDCLKSRLCDIATSDSSDSAQCSQLLRKFDELLLPTTTVPTLLTTGASASGGNCINTMRHLHLIIVALITAAAGRLSYKLR
ncbi:hypothetical protein PR048_007040 [Dryococelus australis]|uniref:Uncharacterized protein n=1 Tax=Dryococelus australis TaxID=614101 RepID=A0ABQ9ICJ7_9NEOP|nr:hypothetical protein PR048_007040 [Dryococelus australis]